MTSSPQDAALNQLQRGLSEFIDRLQSALGETLLSVVLYGGAARGRFDPAVSDVNLMLVLSAISIAELDKIAAAAAPTRLEYQLSLLIVTETDLGDSAEVFPTKFLDIRRHHETLFGPELAKDLQIPRDRLQRQTWRQLMNLHLRLRQAYLDSGRRPEQLDSVLRRSITTLFLHLGILLELRTGKPAANSLEILDMALSAGLDSDGLAELRNFKRNRSALASVNLVVLYEKLTHQVEAALKLADEREVSPHEPPPA